MKNRGLLILSFCLLNTFQAQAGIVSFGLNCLELNCHADPRGGVGAFSDAVCGPELLENNIAAVDRTVSELSREELSGNQRFQTAVQEIAKLEPAARMGAYFKLMGVVEDAEIAKFVGARSDDIDPKYINALIQNVGLNTDQAVMVIRKLSKALMGPQQK